MWKLPQRLIFTAVTQRTFTSSARGTRPLLVWTRNYAAPKAVVTDAQPLSVVDELSINQYHKLADQYLNAFIDEVETLGEQYPQIDIELSQGVMTFELPPSGVYVINKQPPNKQIWLSSPLSGPKRFDLVNGQWTNLRDKCLLTELMAGEIASTLGVAFRFETI